MPLEHRTVRTDAIKLFMFIDINFDSSVSHLLEKVLPKDQLDVGYTDVLVAAFARANDRFVFRI